MGYQLPAAPSKYLRLNDGKTKFRILSPAIYGCEFWVTLEDGTRKPRRFRTASEAVNSPELNLEEGLKDFWVMVVWEYETHSIKVLELTQKSIQKQILEVLNNEDWGRDLSQYDLTITKTGAALTTRYSVLPSNKLPITPEMKQQLENTFVNLEALYDGLDPFSKEDAAKITSKKLEEPTEAPRASEEPLPSEDSAPTENEVNGVPF